MQYNKFETGKEYSLSYLFALDNRIIIPDLQRDYCWGTKTKDGKELVKDFVNNLIVNGINNGKAELSLGLIYGYEIPQGYIQLCDGQQRITTLFLLLGMLNKKTNGLFKERLISPKELEDDRETYLQYAIRESSLYFLSDLSVHFFMRENNLFVKDIRKQPWYFGDYDLDPSIQSMLSAMETIEEVIKEVDAVSFGEYLCEKLKFVYYDMGNRRNGEETFVIINTTGEPLSATENLKPIFINQQGQYEQDECSRLWEKWDTWFWKYRKGAGKKDNDTSDNGFNEFLRWISLLTTDEDTFKEIQSGENKIDLQSIKSASSIDKYFEIVQYLFNKETGLLKENLDWLAPDGGDKYRNSQITWFKLLPLIEYINKFGIDDYRNIIRVKNFFDNIAKIDNVSKAISELLPRAIRIIKELPDKDITSILELKDISTMILSEEEKRKFELYSQSDNREELEDRFWEAENHNIWNGQILSLIKWSCVDEVFQLEFFDKFNKVFNELFHDDLEYEMLDVVRRSLLTRGLKDYPRKFTGSSNYSFCRKDSDWLTLIKDNEDKFGDFLQELINSESINVGLKNMINNNPVNKDYDEFVKIPELLAYCEKKQMRCFDGKEWVLLKYQTMKGARANLKAYRLYLDLRETEDFGKNDKWTCKFYELYNTCVYFDYEENHVAIDILYVGNEKYELQLLRRDDHERKEFLATIAEIFALSWQEYENDGRYHSENMIREELIDLLKKIMLEVENLN